MKPSLTLSDKIRSANLAMLAVTVCLSCCFASLTRFLHELVHVLNALRGDRYHE